MTEYRVQLPSVPVKWVYTPRKDYSLLSPHYSLFSATALMRSYQE